MRQALRFVGDAALLWIACVSVGLADIAASAIQPMPGMVITSTGRSTLVSSSSAGTHGYNNLDQEMWTSVVGVTPDQIQYRYHVGAPSNAQANAEAKKFIVDRNVRRADIEQSTRITLLGSTTDPAMYAGQTFVETSTKALQLLKSGADVPFVLGVNDQSAALAGLASIGAEVGKAAGGAGAGLGGAMSMLAAGRNYYRGTLHRVESGPVQFSVIVNGVRTTFAAIHAAGTFTFGSEPAQHAEFWWLDNPAYPLTLEWVFGSAGQKIDDLVTRIDLPLDSGDLNGTPAGGGGASPNGSGISKLSAQLDKSCHAEMSGIYFNTGSAEILDESKPTLTAVAKLIKDSKFTTLTIEGHTDNIGTAQYNQDLSEKRAAAVRQALLSDYGVPAGRLTAKGFGLTRPVETNATPEGRAHNRRVELSRPCPTQK
jgi:OmpA family